MSELFIRDVPVVCAECKYCGPFVTIKDKRYLTCSMMGNRVVYGSRPNWCPQGPLYIKRSKRHPPHG